MKKYRLKPEAVKWFDESISTSIYDFDMWKKYNVDIKALEEVEDAYLKFGHYTSANGSTLSGWSGDQPEKGSHYHFTIYFPSAKMKEHDEFSNGHVVRDLMNSIQSQINYFYQKFVNKEKDEEY